MKILVTGATKGIGRACVTRLEKKHQILMLARNESALESINEKCPGVVGFYAGDITNKACLKQFTKWLKDNIPDVVIHCVGGNVDGNEGGLSAWEAAMQINFHCIVSMNDILIPLMGSKDGSKIIHISSSSAVHKKATPPYVCAKSALNSYVVCEGRKHAKLGPSIFGIMPAAVEGDSNVWEVIRSENIEKYERMCEGQILGRAQRTEEIAEVIDSLITLNANVFSGCLIPLDSFAC